ncbi:MAG: CRISPR-associated endonuclease Cas1 [Thermoguttaceae bacterium]|jgi:CRISPR-associated protein Cas1|nr:CRISPR-associated endonuclease Cas1 [Thermoguttaceae bacterium]
MPTPTTLATPVVHLVGPGKLHVASGQLAFTAPDRQPLRFDAQTLRSVFCYGQVSVSGDAIELLLHHRVELCWMTQAGFRCHGRLVGDHSDSTSIRILQHRVLALPFLRLVLAREIVQAKIRSQIDAARHYQRQGCRAAGTILGPLQHTLDQCRQASSLDSLRGIEGHASALWFQAFAQLLRAPWQFPRRTRRPPTDPVNALLSLAYTWLTQRAAAVVQARGMEVALGALHDVHPGRPSLACDLIEPLRVPAVDRWVIKLCNRNEISPADFIHEGSAFRLATQVFGRVLANWETHYSQTRQDQALQARLEDIVNGLRRLAEHGITTQHAGYIPPLPEGILNP